MKYDPLDPQLYIYNRKGFAEAMKPNSIAIFHSNDLMPRTGDAYHRWRQNSVRSEKGHTKRSRVP